MNKFAIALTAASMAFAMNIANAASRTPCPNPGSSTYTATSGTVYQDINDLDPRWHYKVTNKINDLRMDKIFLHTYKIKSPGKCCQATSGKLTLKLKKLFDKPNYDQDASNDAITIVSGGTYIPPTKPIGWTQSQQQTTITINLNASALASLQDGTFSYIVEDDTVVLKSKLVLNSCCVNLKKQDIKGKPMRLKKDDTPKSIKDSLQKIR